MIKSAFEKWEELDANVKNEQDLKIVAYYLSSKSITNLYFGMHNKRMFAYIEFTEEELANFDVPKVKGMDIKVTDEPLINPNRKYIRVENELDNKDLFIAFTSSLADVLTDTTSYFDVYVEFKKVIKEYKDYFSNRNYSLPKIEEQGLCAELLELSKMIDHYGEIAIKYWLGPSKNKRDFVLNDNALEVKSTISQINTSITITNENQLDCNFPSNLDNLFLSVYVMEESDLGIDVLTCAYNVLNKIKSLTLKECFIISLIKLKVDLNNYKSKYHFTVQNNYYYSIDEKFPKIIKSNIDNKIFSVSYKIKIDELVNFIVSEDFVYEQF